MRAAKIGVSEDRGASRTAASRGRSLRPPRYGVDIVDARPAASALPEPLAAGIEALAGVSMRDVRVHYGSPAPARLDALAFARGANIHVGPGAERHLAHEAWHVAQQKQGRVPVTANARGTAINHDPALEREADRMGDRAATMPAIARAAAPPRAVAATPAVAQCVFADATTLKDLLTEQEQAQHGPDDYDTPFTTVGFEHEFAQMADGPLRGLTHVEIATSTESMPYTGLNFKLETDADDALELVSPPFVVETLPNTPIPKPEDIAKIDGLIKTALGQLVTGKPKLHQLLTGFTGVGLNFKLADASVGVKSVTPDIAVDVAESNRDQHGHATIRAADMRDIEVVPSRKGPQRLVTISSQVNFATDAQTYDTIQALSTAPTDAIGTLLTSIGDAVHTVLGTHMSTAAGRTDYITPVLDGNMRIFLRELARALAGQVAVPSIDWMQTTNTDVFKGDHSGRQLRNKLSSGKPKDVYELHRGLRSHVKDVGGAWLKDTLANFGLGLLHADQWRAVQRMLTGTSVVDDVVDVFAQAKRSGFKQHEKTEIENNLKAAAGHARSALQKLLSAILSGGWQNPTSLKDAMKNGHGPDSQPSFGSHDPKWFSARQDTLIPSSYVKTPGAFTDRRLHVVEGRGDHTTTLAELKVAHLIRTTNNNDTQIAGATGVDKKRVTEIRQRLALL